MTKARSLGKQRLALTAGVCLVILALAATACRVEYYPTREPSFEETVTSELQDILDVWRSLHGIIGVSLAVDGPKIGVIQAASGISNQETGAAVTTLDRFVVAGLTKTFTAALVLQLVDEGSLSLDDRLERWFPQFRNSRDITLRHLLNHTSGVADYLGPVFLSSFGPRVETETLFDPQELIDFASAEPPSGAPGQGWAYSNTNYVMLGLIAETVTGNPLEHELRSRFFQPLALPDTFLMGVEAVPSVVHGYTTEYAPFLNENGAAIDLDHSTVTLLASSLWAAGGIASNAGDMTTWSKALYGGRVLPQPLLDEMTATSFLTEDLAQSTERDIRSGLGTFLFTTSAGPALEHWGESPGFSALMLYVPSHGIAVTVLTNDDRTQGLRLTGSKPQDLDLLADQVLLAVLQHIRDS